MTDRVTFTCNGRVTEVDVEPGESLLSVLRERLGLVSVKDGCAPQGQCGCCTVLVDGDARVACVTAAARVEGRSITTVEGLDAACAIGARRRSSTPADRSAGSARPASSCAPSPRARPALDKALAAHLCRCTGWRTVYEAIEAHGRAVPPAIGPRLRARRRSRAACPSASSRTCRSAAADSPTTPRRATRSSRYLCHRVRTPTSWKRPGCVGSSARRSKPRAPRRGRCRAGARRSMSRRRCRCSRCRTVACGSRRRGSNPRTSNPTRRGASPAVNPRRRSRTEARSAARSIPARPTPRASWPTHLGRTVRVVYAREDVVRLGPKRPPISATAVWRDGRVVIEGTCCASLVPAAFASAVRHRRRHRLATRPKYPGRR